MIWLRLWLIDLNDCCSQGLTFLTKQTKCNRIFFSGQKMGISRLHPIWLFSLITFPSRNTWLPWTHDLTKDFLRQLNKILSWIWHLPLLTTISPDKWFVVLLFKERDFLAHGFRKIFYIRDGHWTKNVIFQLWSIFISSIYRIQSPQKWFWQMPSVTNKHASDWLC